jgi:superfamily II DNA helicase RecQ
MAYRIFRVPNRNPSAAEAELNGFLRSHRVLSVDRRFVDDGERSFWTFCVDYLDTTGGPSMAAKGGGSPNRSKVDYREVLSPADFSVFVKLREIRKQIAQEEAVPVYTVFTNEQLAQMVTSRATTKAALERLAGWGDAGIEKYGPRVVD